MGKSFDEDFDTFLSSRCEGLKEAVLSNKYFMWHDAQVDKAIREICFLIPPQHQKDFEKHLEAYISAKSHLDEVSWKIAYYQGLREGAKLKKMLGFESDNHT